ARTAGHGSRPCPPRTRRDQRRRPDLEDRNRAGPVRRGAARPRLLRRRPVGRGRVPAAPLGVAHTTGSQPMSTATTYDTGSTLRVLAGQEIRNYLRHKLFWFGTALT